LLHDTLVCRTPTSKILFYDKRKNSLCQAVLKEHFGGGKIAFPSSPLTHRRLASDTFASCAQHCKKNKEHIIAGGNDFSFPAPYPNTP
jgi:hypothetical protein